MYKYKVYVNEEFKDKYTGEVHSIGSTIENLSEERVNEINAVSKTLISIISKELVKSEESKKNDEELEALKKEIEELKADKEKTATQSQTSKQKEQTPEQK